MMTGIDYVVLASILITFLTPTTMEMTDEILEVYGESHLAAEEALLQESEALESVSEAGAGIEGLEPMKLEAIEDDIVLQAKSVDIEVKAQIGVDVVATEDVSSTVVSDPVEARLEELKRPKVDVTIPDVTLWDDSVGFNIVVSNLGEGFGEIELKAYTSRGDELNVEPEILYLNPHTTQRVFVRTRGSWIGKGDMVLLNALTWASNETIEIPVERNYDSNSVNVHSGLDGCGSWALH
jgi:hypothetical protein